MRWPTSRRTSSLPPRIHAAGAPESDRSGDRGSLTGDIPTDSRATRGRRRQHRRAPRNHLVAVEPSTTTAADTFVGEGVNSTAGSIVNSHCTVFRPKNTTVPNISGIGLGAAVKMIRQYNAKPKIFGFNETKITGGACGGVNTAGTVDAGRAEAWEFMVNQGGTYDQFGYKCTPTTDYFETRRQMGVLLKFLTNPVTW